MSTGWIDEFRTPWSGAPPAGDSPEDESALERRLPYLFAGLAALLTLGFYSEFVLNPGQMVFGTDMVDQAYQLREFGAEQVKSGNGMPLWNPFVYSGLPYLAILPGPAFYPTSLLYLVLPLFRAIGWTYALHMFLSGLFAYYAAREFRMQKWAAVVSGLAFMFAGYVVSTIYGGHDSRMFVMVLMPLVFGLVERGFRTERISPFLAAGLVVGCQLLTPHAQLMYFSSLSVALYALYRLVDRYRREGSLRPLARPAGFLVLTFVIGAAVGAVQALPTLEMMGYGVRGGGLEGYEFAASWDVPPQEIASLFLPDLMGLLQQYWGPNPFRINSMYLGAVPLALGCLAVVGARRDRRTWFFGGAGVLALLFALGDATPVHRIFYEVVPLIDRFRAAEMMIGPVSFFVAMLAGLGWHRVLAARESAGADAGGNGDAGSGEGGGVEWWAVWLLSAPFLLFALAAALSPESLQQWARRAWFPANYQKGPGTELAATLRTTGWIVLVGWIVALGTAQAVAQRRVPRWAVAAPMLLLVVDLWRVDARFLQTVDPDRAFSRDAAVRYMQENTSVGERVWPVQRSYGPNELMYFDLPAVTGSQNFRLAWYDHLVGGVGYRNLARAPVLWQLLDVKFVTSRQTLDTELLTPATQAAGKMVYRVGADAPHAFFPRSVITVADSSAARQRTMNLSSYREAAVVEGADARPPAGSGSASVVSRSPERMELRVNAEERGLLVVSEVYHPNWTATVDGEEVPVYRTDAALRGVVVPAGSHTLTFRYESTSYRAGLGLTLGGTVLTLLGLGAARYRRRRDG
ncbi:MAG: YfhO family protein [Candidatus Palauibacterales bacterium]|nr:YfhO family protein [Candidatus Palauibacterales bacterium]